MACLPKEHNALLIMLNFESDARKTKGYMGRVAAQ